MDSIKDKGSRSSSKVNLNESSVPLLDEEETAQKVEEGKVVIEMEERSPEKEKEEEAQADGKSAETKEEKENKKKEKKEKKKKEKKEKTHTRTPSFADRFTAGLNLLDRDERNVNGHVNIVFEDVLAEPDASHGFDAIWRLAFFVFSGTKLWVYRVLAALLAVPCGLLWGGIFSIIALLNVWIISPFLRTFDVVMHIVHRVWGGVVRAFLNPIFQSIGQVCSNVNITNRKVIEEQP